VSLARPDTGSQAQQVDTELRQSGRFTQAAPFAIPAGLIERGGITCAGALGRNERVDPGHLRFLTSWLYRMLTIASIRNKRGW
jgi:hypothetical protein